MDPITKAFKELTKRGYLAERCLACCRSCASHQIPEDKESMYVYTTSQSDKYPQYLYWSAPNDNPNEIIKALRKQGIKVKKPKNAAFAIEIK